MARPRPTLKPLTRDQINRVIDLMACGPLVWKDGDEKLEELGLAQPYDVDDYTDYDREGYAVDSGPMTRFFYRKDGSVAWPLVDEVWWPGPGPASTWRKEI